MPTDNVVVDWLAAVPLAMVTGVPKFVPSIMNWIVPVAMLGRVAVKVTAWPAVEGFTDELTVTVPVIWLTTWPPLKVPVAALCVASPE